MRHLSLDQVRHRVVAGRPLPFNVYRPDTTLLLARGQVLDSEAQIDALLERGSLVDAQEAQEVQEVQPASQRAVPPDASQAPRAALPALWQDSIEHVAEVILNPASGRFADALDEATAPLRQLIERDPDLAIFQVLRQEGNDHVQYGVRQAVHAGIVADLVANRLGWSAGDKQRAFKAALTMNVSMFELQGILAAQLTPPTTAQRERIQSHPMRSRDLLVAAGITDTLWLQAVAEHHEERNGSGYPLGITEPCELALLLHRAEDYSAKLGRRATRDAVPADCAGREIFMADPGHPVCAALIKEFGVYPPGCFVALASGETGVVIKRGPTVMAPIVAALTNASGAPLREPQRRDTLLPLHAIVGVLPAGQMRVPVDLEKLTALAD